MLLRRHEEAIASLERLMVRDYWVSALMAGCNARMANTGRATALAAECLKAKPDFSIGLRIAKEPFRNAGDTDYLVQSLKMAGLPE